MNISEQLKSIITNHSEAFQSTFDDSNIHLLESIAQEMASCLERGNKLLFCGNGGSASDSQHIAAEFIGRFKKERESLAALALTTDTSIITALANDYSYDIIFQRQVEGLGKEGDILFGISTSGNSKNVLLAVEKAKVMGIKTIGFTGQKGGKLEEVADLCFKAQTTITSHIQEMHITALHAVSEIVEDIFARVQQKS